VYIYIYQIDRLIVDYAIAWACTVNDVNNFGVK
jgi:hypothetical protein